MMKNSFSTNIIYKLLILLTIISIPFALPASASAGVMQWTVVNTPDNFNNIIASPSEINFMAVSQDGYAMYATDVPHNRIYRSRDSGKSWQDISIFLLNAGATLPVWNIELAPDNPEIVAAVTSIAGQPRNVFISFDGGENWQNLNCNAPNPIGTMVISPNYGSHDIAVGTRNGAGGGNLLIFKMIGGSTWVNQGLSGDVIATKFSTNYNSDYSILTVSADASGTFLNLGVRDVMANSTFWASWLPLEITTAGSGTSPKANQIRTAGIELPSDFLGQTPGKRRLFISTNDGNATGNAGIYRIDDTSIYRITPPIGNKMISSISYFGTYSSGKLLAGEVKADTTRASVDTWICLNAAQNCPMASCLIWQKATKPPTGGANSGNANAQVFWSKNGTAAFCTTSSADLVAGGWPNGYMISQAFDESAFSYSIDNANTWNQISLIDTEISFLADVVATYNSDTLYIASINTNAGLTGFDSIWRGTGYPLFTAWERIMCSRVNTDDVILRVDFTQPEQIFAGFRATPDIYFSDNRGQTWNNTIPNINVTDFQAVNINGIPNLVVLSNDTVRRGEYTGTSWKWWASTNTTLFTGHSLSAYPNGVIIAGDTSGSVAYSENFGASFDRLPSLPVSGNVNAIVDTRIRNYTVIYAATSDATSDIYNYIPGSSSRWLNMSAPRQEYYGLTLLGTFYGAWASGGNTGAVRTLNPEALGEPFIEWSNLTSGLPAGISFTREPCSLKISAGINLWAIDNSNYTASTGRLWQFTDGLAAGPTIIVPPEYSASLLAPPYLMAPTDGTILALDLDTEEVSPIEFKWRHDTQANGYDLWISRESGFSQMVLQQSTRPPNVMSPSFILPAKNSPLKPGETYYWKVRVNRVAGTYQRAEGQWSDIMSFSIAPKYIPESLREIPVLTVPEDKASVSSEITNFQWEPISGAKYRFILSNNEDLSEPLLIDITTHTSSFRYTGQLQQGKTYYWQVAVVEPYIGEPSSTFSFSVPQEQLQQRENILSLLPIWLYLLMGAVIIAAAVIPASIFTVKNKRRK